MIIGCVDVIGVKGVTGVRAIPGHELPRHAGDGDREDVIGEVHVGPAP
jgi:hypothetical protein